VRGPTLLELWSSVLNAEAIGVLDRVVDFSDSIMATQFLHRVRETFGITVSMASLFRETTTLAELAELIERTTVGASATPEAG
jgi:acyl carrier protein